MVSNAICLGCAGGFEVTLFVDFDKDAFEGETYKIQIAGYVGGHSGCDIHRGRGNAIKDMASLLGAFDDIRLYAMDGGSVINTIPRSCSAIVWY